MVSLLLRQWINWVFESVYRVLPSNLTSPKLLRFTARKTLFQDSKCGYYPTRPSGLAGGFSVIRRAPESHHRERMIAQEKNLKCKGGILA